MTTTELPPAVTRPQVAPGRLFIGGTWTEAAAGGRTDVVDPATGEVVTTVARGQAADVDAAVAAARAALPAWRATPAPERARVLLRMAALVREHADEIAAVESLDVGKPISLSRAVDVETAADTYEYYAALARTSAGEQRPVGLPAHAYTRREPLGVVAAITPFNFPLILSSTKIAPALAAGNTVVHKPAEETPLSALLMARLLAEAGVPDGVVNVVTGLGAEAGDALLHHPGTDTIAFTGSTSIGRRAARAAADRLVPATLELGGNGAQIVFADADVEQAIGSAIKAFVFNTGQFCMAGPRLLVARPLLDTVLGALAQAVPTVPVGDPFDPGTVVGPLAAARHRDKVAEHVRDAVASGATVVAGGAVVEGPGFFHQPTVLTDLPADARVITEEVFGPVLTVQAFDTEDEAVALANGVEQGLAAGLHTRDVARAHRVAARLDAGIVWVNDWALLDPAMPFGGTKASGHGRENGPEGLAAYTRTTSVLISLA
jgi:acyl-CoA reductase-like NAD-dependent aldehyde dehydrogenase